MHMACWIPEAINTYLAYVILINFHGNGGCTYAFQCCVICTLPVLFAVCKSVHLLGWKRPERMRDK